MTYGAYLSPALQALVPGVPGYVVVFVLLEQVPRTRAIRLVQSVLTLHQEQGALQRGAEHFVRIPRHGIRTVSIEQRVRSSFEKREQSGAGNSIRTARFLLIATGTFPKATMYRRGRPATMWSPLE